MIVFLVKIIFYLYLIFKNILKKIFLLILFFILEELLNILII
jgi:hypothetical protein